MQKKKKTAATLALKPIVQCLRAMSHGNIDLLPCNNAVINKYMCLFSTNVSPFVCFFPQHLVWILGLKPGVGGALKPGRAVEGPSTVCLITLSQIHFFTHR